MCQSHLVERKGASRRDVVRGMAIGSAGVLLNPMAVFGSMGQTTAKAALPRSSAEAAGVDPAAVSAFVDAVNAKVGGLHSMMLLRHGKVAAEAWWKPFTPDRTHVLYSLSKSFTSTAVGLAVAEGRLSVDDTVVSFFPDKLPEKVSENLAKMRVRDLLTMSSGHETEPGRASADWVKEFLAAPVPRTPGSHFLYNTSATHVLAAIVQKVTGGRVLDYLKPRLFEPLGIEGATWEQSPAGIDTGGFGLKLKTEDIAKFGQLLLQKGEWNGKRLIAASWVEEATKKQVSNGNPADNHDWCQGYGYQFWRCRHDSYRGDGAFGQYCVVMPGHDAVLAITSGIADMGAVLEAAWTHLLPGFKDGGSAADAEALRKKLASLSVPGPEGKATSPLASKVSGKRWTLAKNDEGFTTAGIVFTEGGGVLENTGPQGTRKIPFGTGGWVSGEETAAWAAWTADDRLVLKVCLLDSPHAWTETLVFDGDDLKVEGRAWNVMFGPTARPDLKGTPLAG